MTPEQLWQPSVEEPRPLLVVDGLVTGYGKKRVLNEVSIQVAAGEIVAVIGHNGAGKSTLLRAIFGVLPIWGGHVYLDGALMKQPSPREMLRQRVAYVPQGNRVFGDLTVRENLEIGGRILDNKIRIQEAIDRVLVTFPALKNRLRQQAATLSGGEKQIVALGNALIVDPRLLLLDEPSLGLSPSLVTSALEHISRITKELGTAALIVEQKVREVLRISQRVYVLRNGAVTYCGEAGMLQDDNTLRAVYM